MASAQDLLESWATEPCMEDVNVIEKHEKAIKLQTEVRKWMERSKLLFETGIRYPERRLVIYLPPGEVGEGIKRALVASHIDGIEEEADFAELNTENRKRLAMYPGRTPILFGDGSSATLGTFVRDPVSQTLYALTSQHTKIPMMGRDVFVKLGELLYRLGKVVADVKQTSPVVDACLVEVDVENEEIYKQINLTMFFTEPTPPLYLKMHEDASNIGIMDAVRLQVSKYGYSTKGTNGVITEYSRDLVEDGNLLTDNIVTVSANLDPIDKPFAAEGDSGSIVFRSVRNPQENIYFYDALSMLYMADKNTGESFSIPLPRCLSELGKQIDCQLELATQNPAFHLDLE